MARKQATPFSRRAPRRTAAGLCFRTLRVAAALAVALACVRAGAPALAAPLPVDSMRAVWVEARPADLVTPEARAALLERVRATQADTIFVEVLTAGRAIYESRNVPTAPGFTVQGTTDPVRALLEEARRAEAGRVRVVAVLDPLRLGEAPTGEAGADHPARKHADWLTQDASGAKADAEKAVWLDPGLPAVHDFAAAMVREFLERYDVDGVHLAHLRYPGSDGRWGYHPDAVRLFQETPGQGDAAPDPQASEWVRWRTDRVTALLRRLGETARAARPGAVVSAGAVAIGPAPGEGPRAAPPEFEMACQDWPAWCHDALADWIVLEDFHANAEQQERFVRWIDFARTSVGSVRLAVAMSGHLNSDSDVLMQMRLSLGRNVGGLVLVGLQEPARGKDVKSDFVAFLGKTVFSPDYVLPEYVERVATAAPAAPLPAITSVQPVPMANIALATGLPPPLFIDATPPPKMRTPAPGRGGEGTTGGKKSPKEASERSVSTEHDGRGSLSQVDASYRLLGIKPGEAKSAASGKSAGSAKGKATASAADNSSPEPELPGAPWVTVELKGGGKFEAQLVNRDDQNVTLRRFRGRVNVVLPVSRIEAIRLLEGHP